VVLLILHLDLGRAADALNTAREVVEALPELPAVIVGGGLLDLGLDLAGAGGPRRARKDVEDFEPCPKAARDRGVDQLVVAPGQVSRRYASAAGGDGLEVRRGGRSVVRER
jgi:hypothetical protein